MIIAVVMIFLTGFTSFAYVEVKDEPNKNEVIKLTLKRAMSHATENSEDMKVAILELESSEKQHMEYREHLERDNHEYVKDYYGINFPLTHKYRSVNKLLKENGAKKKKIDLILDIAKWNVAIMENKIRYDVEKIYYDLIQAKQDMDIADESLKLTNIQYDQSKKMLELGIIPEQYLLDAKVGLYHAQTGYNTAYTIYQIHKINFNIAIGLPSLQEVEIIDGTKFEIYKNINLESDVKKANENNATLKIALENKEIAKLVFEAIEDSLYEIESTPHRWKYGDEEKIRELKRDHREKKVEIGKAEKEIQLTKSSVDLYVITTGMNLLNTEKQIDIHNTAVTNKLKDYEVAKLKFQLGEITLNKVNQAGLELMNAKKDLSKQMHIHNLAYLEYKYSIGLGKDILNKNFN